MTWGGIALGAFLAILAAAAFMRTGPYAGGAGMAGAATGVLVVVVLIFRLFAGRWPLEEPADG